MLAPVCGDVCPVQYAGTDWGITWRCHDFHGETLDAENQRWTGYILPRGSYSGCCPARVPELSQPQTQAIINSIINSGKTLNYFLILYNSFKPNIQTISLPVNHVSHNTKFSIF